MRFAGITAAVVATAVAIVLLPLANKGRLRSTDFVNFYAGASIVLRGDGARLYDPAVQGPLLQSLSGLPLTEYFLHPPFEAALMAPLALLPFRTAYVVWTALNAALIAALGWPFAEAIPVVRHRPIVGMLGFFYLPVLVALMLGQDSILLLAILAIAYMLLPQLRRPGILLSWTAR